MSYVQIVRKALQECTEKKVEYSVIRNHNFLFENRPYEGKDVDILVNKEFFYLMKSILVAQGFSELIVAAKHYRVFVKYGSDDKRFISLHLHINNVYRAEYPVINGSFFFEQITIRDQICIANATAETAILVIKSLNTGQGKDEKYKQQLELLWPNANKHALKKLLTYSLGEKNAEELAKDLSKVYAHKHSLYQTMIDRCVTSSVKLKNKLSKITFILKKIIRPAPLVTFIGMDGAGKSTTTANVLSICDQSLVKASLLYVGRGKRNILPIQKVGKKVARSKKQKKKKYLYVLAAPVFALDLYARYWFRIYPDRLKKSLVLTDRYCTDILLMKNVPSFMRSILYAPFPRPTKIIYLYNDVDVLHKRKPDHPYEDLKRQEALFKKVVPKVKAVKIRSEGEEKTLTAVMKQIKSLVNP